MSSRMLFPDAVIQEAFSKKETWNNARNYWTNHLWFQKNQRKLKKSHSGQLVIVLNEEVFFSSEDAEKVRKKLRHTPNRYEAYIQYIPAANELLLL